MKFAFSTNAFRRYSLQEAVKIIAALGYDGIEIMADVPHAFPLHLSEEELREIRSTLHHHHLEISNINAFMHHADGDTYHPTWIETDPALRRKRIDYTLRCIDLAASLGADTISTEPGGPLEGLSREAGMEYFLEGLAAIEQRARDRGIRVLIEPEPGLLIENSTQFLELYKQLDPAVFGLNFDIGHFYCVGEDPAALVDELADATFHFHLEDIAASREHYHLLLGEGAVDIPEVLNRIETKGYEGFVTVELYTYEHDPGNAAQKALDYLSPWRKRA